MKKFIFDVDGTLTPSRKSIDINFENFFYDFCVNNPVYLVTGSDRPKTVEQIGQRILNSVELCFNCAGNEVWKGNHLISKEEWNPPDTVVSYLEHLLEKSKFNIRAGNHIELRNGMLNFSIVGRNCNETERQEYIKWDKSTNERVHLVDKITSNFKNIDCYIGGETGVDIFPKGFGKIKTIDKIRTKSDDILYYFGDQVFENGNDYHAAMKCDHRYNVKSWNETKEILSYFIEACVCE